MKIFVIIIIFTILMSCMKKEEHKNRQATNNLTSDIVADSLIKVNDDVKYVIQQKATAYGTSTEKWLSKDRPRMSHGFVIFNSYPNNKEIILQGIITITEL